MGKYIGTKIIEAVPGRMVNGCYWPEGLPLPEQKCVQDPIDPNAQSMKTVIEEGYFYASDNGYTCWASKEDFEKEFRSVENMSFGQAIEAAKQGKQIARRGWNGKGQYVEIATGITYTDPYGGRVDTCHDAIGNRAFAFVGTSGVQMGWLASQADMLAEDWYIVDIDLQAESES